MKLTRQGVRDLGNSRPRRDSRPRRTCFGIRRQRLHIDPTPDGRPRVAVDVCVSSKEIHALEEAGFHVVVVAEEGEPDHDWLLRASAAKVDIVCSPDKGVWIWAYDCDLAVAELDGNSKSDVLAVVRSVWSARSSR